MSNQQDQLIPTQPSSIDENHPNSKIDQNDNQEPQLISQLEEQNKNLISIRISFSNIIKI